MSKNILILLLIVISCSAKDANKPDVDTAKQEAVRLNDKAVNLFQNYLLYDGDIELIYAAIDTIDIAISLDSLNGNFYYNKSNMLIALDSTKEAINTLLLLYEVNPIHIRALFLAGNYFEIQGLQERADSLYMKALIGYQERLEEKNTDLNIVFTRDWAYVHTFLYGKDSTFTGIEKLSGIDESVRIAIVNEIKGLERKEYLNALSY